MKRYPLQLPESLHMAVKIAAASDQSRTMNDIIVEATAKALGVDLKEGGKGYERRVVG